MPHEGYYPLVVSDRNLASLPVLSLMVDYLGGVLLAGACTRPLSRDALLSWDLVSCVYTTLFPGFPKTSVHFLFELWPLSASTHQINSCRHISRTSGFATPAKLPTGDLDKYNPSPRLSHMKKTAYAKAGSHSEDPSFLREAPKDGDLNIDGPTKTSALFDLPSRR